MAKFAILGYGKMGKEVGKVILAQHHDIVAIIDNENDWKQRWNDFLTADVAVEFSMPSVAVENFRKCFDNQIPLVAGTTGWYDRTEEVVNYCREKSSSFIYGSNFSIGVNIFFQINRLLADIMSSQPDYSVSIEETHHVAKKDAPSGTAIHLAKIIEQQYDNQFEVPITSYRLTDVPGIHRVTYKTENEVIELTHTANNRVELAKGAVKAALWLLQHPGIYDYKDIALNK